MENASKALLIAGGILLALIIITTFVYLVGHVKTIKQVEATKAEVAQLQKFNQEYEAYNKKLMYGAEVHSVINKIKDNNKKYAENINFQITYVLEDFTEEEIEKTSIYTCTAINYSDSTGRVSSMSFKKHES